MNVKNCRVTANEVLAVVLLEMILQNQCARETISQLPNKWQSWEDVPKHVLALHPGKAQHLYSLHPPKQPAAVVWEILWFSSISWETILGFLCCPAKQVFTGQICVWYTLENYSPWVFFLLCLLVDTIRSPLCLLSEVWHSVVLVSESVFQIQL